MARRRCVVGVALVTVLSGAAGAARTSRRGAHDHTHDPASRHADDIADRGRRAAGSPAADARAGRRRHHALGAGWPPPRRPRGRCASWRSDRPRRPRGRQPREHAVDDGAAAPRATTRSPPTRAVLPALRAAGSTRSRLANNHTGDYGGRTGRDRRGLPRPASGRSAPAGTSPRAPGRGASTPGMRLRVRRASTPSVRPPRPDPATGALSVRMPPRTGPLHRADLDRVTRRRPPARPAGRRGRGAPALGRRSTPTLPSRSSTRSRRRWSRPAPTSSSAATRTGCRALDASAAAGRALAGQLRLRHGLHGADHGGGGPDGDVLG